MPDFIGVVTKTRGTSLEILAQSLVSLKNSSEKDVHDLILANMAKQKNIFPEGWYAPPPEGIGIIFDNSPFERLKYDSLRKEEFWPKDNLKFGVETVGMIYFSPVDKVTGTMGDIGFT